jgi:hypothetical protein
MGNGEGVYGEGFCGWIEWRGLIEFQRGLSLIHRRERMGWRLQGCDGMELASEEACEVIEELWAGHADLRQSGRSPFVYL